VPKGILITNPIGNYVETADIRSAKTVATKNANHDSNIRRNRK